MLKFPVVQLLSAIPIMPPWCFLDALSPRTGAVREKQSTEHGSVSTVQEPELDEQNF